MVRINTDSLIARWKVQPIIRSLFNSSPSFCDNTDHTLTCAGTFLAMSRPVPTEELLSLAVMNELESDMMMGITTESGHLNVMEQRRSET